MMKRISFLLVLWLVCVVTLQAKRVDSTRLAAYASQFIQAVHQEGQTRTINGLESVNGKPNLAVVAFAPSGWVLMATDDVAEPILGYSLTGSFTFDSTRVNPGFTHLLRSYEKQIQLLKLNPNQPINEKWITSGVRLRSATEATSGYASVAPLVAVNWNQNAPWNQSCPVDVNGPGGHVYVGCVAVAMGQAMSVYQYPTKGTGKADYVDKKYGYQYVIFDDYGNYNWLNMQTSTANKDIADFLYHCAVSVEMSFGPNGSGAYATTAATALKTYFGYSSSVACIDKGGTDAQWTALLNAELEAGRPLIYAGDGGDGQPGHAFNIDGYVQNDYSTLYHINWGWSGAYSDEDDYFSINVLNPGSYDFSYNNQVIVGIKPTVPGPISLSLSNNTVQAGLPAGTTVATIDVEDDWSGNTYIFSLSGTFNPFTRKERPLYFMEENGILKTTKEFQYVTGSNNKEGVAIKVTDQFKSTLSKEFYIDILPPSATPLEPVEAGRNGLNLHYSPAERLLSWDELDGPVHIAVYNLQGQLQREQTTTANRMQVELPQGMYLVRLTAKDVNQTIKVVSSSSL